MAPTAVRGGATDALAATWGLCVGEEVVLVEVAALGCKVGVVDEDGGGRGGGDGEALVPRVVALGCSLVQVPGAASRCVPPLGTARPDGPPPPCTAARCCRGASHLWQLLLKP